MPAQQSVFNVTEFIDQRPFGWLQSRVALICGIVMLVDGADSLSIGLAAPAMAKALNLSTPSLGPVFGMGQAGVLLGALILGSLADRFGRKRTMLFSLLLFGIGTLVTVWASSLNELLLFRLLAGLGLGGATPNAVALTAEYTPKRIRSALVAALWAAFPLGGVVIGLTSARLIPSFGWESIFYVGGLVPLVLCAAIFAILPESPGFLAVRPGQEAVVRRLLQRLSPGSNVPADAAFVADSSRLPGVPVRYLFSDGHLAPTLLIWVACFTSFLILIFVISWIPALLREHDVSMANVGFAIALHSIGSVFGSAAVGRAMDRFGQYLVLGIAFFATAIATALLGSVITDFSSLAIVIAINGFFAGASQAGVIALAATNYPVAVRSTGVGWAIALGRLGAVVGPLVGGMLLHWNWGTQAILMAVAIPALIGGLAVLGLKTVRGTDALARRSLQPG